MQHRAIRLLRVLDLSLVNAAAMTGREGEDVTAPESMAKLWHEIIE